MARPHDAGDEDLLAYLHRDLDLDSPEFDYARHWIDTPEYLAAGHNSQVEGYVPPEFEKTPDVPQPQTPQPPQSGRTMGLTDLFGGPGGAFGDKGLLGGLFGGLRGRQRRWERRLSPALHSSERGTGRPFA
jgi:hypothetical protein